LVVEEFLKIETITGEHHINGLIELYATGSTVDVNHEVLIDTNILAVLRCVISDKACSIPVEFFCKLLFIRFDSHPIECPVVTPISWCKLVSTVIIEFPTFASCRTFFHTGILRLNDPE